MFRVLIIVFSLLLMASNAFSEITSMLPKSATAKPLYVKSKGKVRYTSLMTLGQILSMMNSSAESDGKQLYISKSEGFYLINLHTNSKHEIKFFVDSNNFLKKAVVVNGLEKYELTDSNPEKMVGSLAIVLPFSDGFAKAAEARNEKNKQAEQEYIRENLLNYTVHMPLFAGMTWGDKYTDVLKKLQNVKGISDIEVSWDFGDYFYDNLPKDFVDKWAKDHSVGYNKRTNEATEDETNDALVKKREQSIKTDIKLTVNGNTDHVATSNDLVFLSDYADYCAIKAKILLFNTEAEIEFVFGGNPESHDGPLQYLNSINIKGKFIGENYKSLRDAYKAKYKSFADNKTSFGAPDADYLGEKFKVCDKFGNCVNFHDVSGTGETEGVAYIKSESIKELQMKILDDALQKKKEGTNNNKNLPQADDSL